MSVSAGLQAPRAGDVVGVRQRRWLVGGVLPGARPGDATLVKLSCLDVDAAGDPLEILWEIEVDAEVIPERAALLDDVSRLDPPDVFGAYLNSLLWDCVTSTDKRLLQAPFRAGIDLKPYQLDPLRKALELPRVNLFIADDVGLGKTIEAGLIMQELILRQRIDRVLVIAPPQVTLQWQEELEQRFGLRFEIYNRELVSDRRRERGFGINPWTTHPRFIVSTALLRGSRSRRRGTAPRTQHLSLLLGSLKSPEPRSLLILDEAHHAAPASGSVYAVDSHTTRAIRQLASRFEHRLFLSATPHNGLSNSFSALLELLDPQRFNRGVKVSVRELAPVMIRRLKKHLRAEVGGLPERKLVDHRVRLEPDSPEVRLGELLGRYEEAYKASLCDLPTRERTARGLVCVNLHKRLLSSIDAFSRTLEVHARAAEKRLVEAASRYLPSPPSRVDDDLSEDEVDLREDEYVEAATVAPPAAALEILRDMRAIGRGARGLPDERLLALAAWIRENLCPGGSWNDRRVVVFTEYDDTMRWIGRLLPGLLRTTDTDGRIDRYHGGTDMGTRRREALKRAFTSSPRTNRLRVLLATDAAREGINLQAYCYDLFHFDLPWNPTRVEQRNGRIDRTLQPAAEVFCHYFDLPDRPEDKVLTYMLRRLDTIQRELGSLSDVLSERLARRMDEGIRNLTPDDVKTYLTPSGQAVEAARELEGRYDEDAKLLRGDLQVLERQLERSRRAVGYDRDHLRHAVDLGLRMACGEGLRHLEPPTDPRSWKVPGELDRSWEATLAVLREEPKDGAPPWHKPPVRPVAFRAAHRLDADTVQLHLGHPFVKRLLSRYRARGFAAYDLSRVALLLEPDETVRRVIALGRLALYGHGATRLHEEVVAVAARWTPDAKELQPYAADAQRHAYERLQELLRRGPSPHPQDRAQRAAMQSTSRDFAILWRHLETVASTADAKARDALARRGSEEAEALSKLLLRQKAAIHKAFDTRLPLFEKQMPRSEREQLEREDRAMHERLEAIPRELEEGPGRIQRGYEVVLRRLEPVGLVYLWPES